MQNYSFHTHTNSFGVFDGQNSTQEMIKKAEEIGFIKLGISNHLIFHPNIKKQAEMFFYDYDEACGVYKKNIEEIRTTALKAKIDVKVGFEVDFFQSGNWRNLFEKMQKDIKADYYIGSTHNLFDKKESNIMNLYYLSKHPDIRIEEVELTKYLNNYWDNIVESIKSGYFNFIAHIDVCKLFGYCRTKEWDERKWEVIETLAKYKQPYEINTSGWTKINEQHPQDWVIIELNKRNVPVIISDDAHATERLAQHFQRAEELLQSINYTNRYCPDF